MAGQLSPLLGSSAGLENHRVLPEPSVSPGPLTGHDGQKIPAVKLFAPTVAPSPALGTAAAARSALVLTKSWNGCTRPPKAVTSAKTRLLENLLESALPVRKKPPNPTVLRSQQGAELSLPHFQRVQGAWLSEEGTSGGENQSAPKPSRARGHHRHVSSFPSCPGERVLAQLSGTPRDERAGSPQAASAEQKIIQ